MSTRTIRAAALATTAVLALALAGCTSTGAASTASTSGSGSGTKIKSVTFVNPLPDYPAWKVIGQCMAKEAKKKGMTFTQSGQTGSSIDTTYMVNRVQQAIAIKTNAIVTFPVSAAQFDPLFLQAKNKGIYTASVEGGQTKNNDINVGTSFSQFGQLAAETVAKKSKTENVGFVTEGATGPDAQFITAFTKWVAANPSSGIKILDTRYDAGDPTQDPNLINAMLTAHPTMNMIVTNEGAATSPIISVLKQNNLKGKVFLTTNSKYSGSVPGMKDGYVYSFLLQDMCGIGTTAIDGLSQFSSGALKGKSTDIATKILFATKGDYAKLIASGKFQ
ncbi:sugar ABC transporter substrate-binding protein [Frondihabitans sp. PAMC 28766]|uniref:sugar ABC transporter substrate-binding protein n=1 Tax=Frondihabitans sp. PAMC 28766 TaxID=1795630 RepID=UPI0012FFBE17|nr:sugar ABC transporter substrate-binding protein [Frondihabitans sp. PAMC 28766]